MLQCFLDGICVTAHLAAHGVRWDWDLYDTALAPHTIMASIGSDDLDVICLAWKPLLHLPAGGGLVSVGVDRVGRLLGHDEARGGTGVPQGGRGHASRHSGRPPGSDRGETIYIRQKKSRLLTR